MTATVESYDSTKQEAWRAATRAREVDITIVEDDGFVRTVTDIDDLSDLAPDHLDRVGMVGIHVGGVPISASVKVSRRYGLDVRVRGKDRTSTAGLRHELQDILKPRVRLRWGLLPTEEMSVAVGFTLSSLTVGAVLLYFFVGKSFVSSTEFSSARYSRGSQTHA
jgi:hypothetical protein